MTIGRGVARSGDRIARPRFLDTLDVYSLNPTRDLRDRMPDIMEFILSKTYLNRPIYPRQATFLKLIFLQEEVMTQYDIDVLDEWASGFRPPVVEQGKDPNMVRIYEGGWGIAPDWRERIKLCKAQGRMWFREVDAVLGRRSGKGYIGAIAGAYILWYYILLGDIQGYFGIARDKQIEIPVFAGKKEQAKVNQWRDLYLMLSGAPCFEKYESKYQTESMTLYSRGDAIVYKDLERRGLTSHLDYATFRIVPKESTLMAGRGPASIMQYYDEMAHVVPAVASASAEDVYGAATPSLDQVRPYEFIYAGSSPWQMMGQFYENTRQALSFDPNTGLPVRANMLMLQLTSWDIYNDWDIAKDLPLVPDNYKKKIFIGDEVMEDSSPLVREDGKACHFDPLQRAIQAYDDEMKVIENADPEQFRVERLSQWATALDAYLNAEMIKKIWDPWPTPDRYMTIQTDGALATRYVAHGDPSVSGDNFGFAIAHVEGPDDNGYPHVVFDLLHAWKPSEFPDNRIDYIVIENELKDYIKRFVPELLTFDQFNSPGLIDHLRAYERSAQLPKRVMIDVQTATAPLNWTMAETFKTALNMGLIHAPMHDIANLELQFLQQVRGGGNGSSGRVDHPSSGPVKSKDVVDCFDDQTEVLTASGWKLFLDVGPGEAVATRSSDGVLEYQVPSEYIARHHQGRMFTYEGERLNFSVTPGHRMLVTPYHSKTSWQFVNAEDLTFKLYRVPKTALVEDLPCGWVDLDDDRRDAVRVVNNPGRRGSGEAWLSDEEAYLVQHYATAPMEDLCSVLTGRSRSAIYRRAAILGLERGQIGDRVGDLPDRLPKTSREDFASFLGFWLAEGAKYRNGYDVVVFQSKVDGIAWVDALMDRLGWPVVRRQVKDEVIWGVKSRGLRDYLRRCVDGPELSLPQEVFDEWSMSEKAALLDGLMMGDGTVAPSGRTYYSSSKTLIDDVQRLIIHLGRQGRVRRSYETGVKRSIREKVFYATKPGYSIHDNSSDIAMLETVNMKQIDYDGMVYCLTVPNGTLLTRRNDIPFWAGNCMMNCVYNLVGDEIGAMFSKSLGGALRGAGVLGGTLTPMGGQDSGDRAIHEQMSRITQRGARPGGRIPPRHGLSGSRR